MDGYRLSRRPLPFLRRQWQPEFPGWPGPGTQSGFAGAGDDQGVTKAYFDVLTNNAGRIEALGATGSTNFFAGPNGTNGDNGIAAVFSDAGNIDALIASASFGSGAVETFGSNGTLNTLNTSVTGLNNAGAFALFDSTNTTSIVMLAGLPGRPSYSLMEFYGGNGSTNLTTSGTDDNTGFLALADDAGNNRTSLSVNADGSGRVETFGTAGTPNVLISSSFFGDDLGEVSLFDSTSTERAYINGRGIPGYIRRQWCIEYF